MAGNIYIGTSGWNYKHWKGTFYPEDLTQKKWLEYFQSKLKTVEINNTFYKVPKPETFQKWEDSVPDTFLYSVKANRYITHMKKLLNPEDSLDSLENFRHLKKKLGPILFQLPPSLAFNEERLRNFIQHLPQLSRYTFEFRHKSWMNETTFNILKEHNIAFCIYELAGFQSPVVATADFVYIRLHGPSKVKYQGKYSQQQLEEWADYLMSWQDENIDSYIYFDNDEQGFAPQNALELIELVG